MILPVEGATAPANRRYQILKKKKMCNLLSNKTLKRCFMDVDVT